MKRLCVPCSSGIHAHDGRRDRERLGCMTMLDNGYVCACKVNDYGMNKRIDGVVTEKTARRCGHCGVTYAQTMTRHGRYCSLVCRDRAAYARRLARAAHAEVA